MRIFKPALSVFFILFLTLIQMTSLLAFDLIKPNLLLIGFAVLIIFADSFWTLIWGLATVGFIFIVFGFWRLEWIFLIFLIAGGFFFNKFFKGRQFLNFLSLIFLMTAGFYFLNIFRFPLFNFRFLIGELILNLGWGLIFYILATTDYYEKQRP